MIYLTSLRPSAVFGRASNTTATRARGGARNAIDRRTREGRFVVGGVSRPSVEYSGEAPGEGGGATDLIETNPSTTNSTSTSTSTSTTTSTTTSRGRLLRRSALRALVASVAAFGATGATTQAASAGGEVKDWANLSDEEWQRELGGPKSMSYRVLRKAATEPPFTSPLNKEYRPGTFVCAGCGSKLFDSAAKFNSGTGWPSFVQALPGAVDESEDLSIIFMPRTEVSCHTCHGHLGHVFPDGPEPTGLRYCMNGAALRFASA